MRRNHLLLISSSVKILYCMYVYILYLFRKILCYSFHSSIFPIFLTVQSGISDSFRYFGFV